MKKTLFIAVSLAFWFVSSAFAGSDNSFVPFGSYYDTKISTESVVTVTTYTVTEIPAVRSGVYRIYQNTGTENLGVFNVLSSSNTSGIRYMEAGEKWIEDKYFGVQYFKSVGAASTTLYKFSVENK